MSTTTISLLRATTCVLAACAFGSLAAAQSAPRPKPAAPASKPATPPPPPVLSDPFCKDNECPDLVINIEDSRIDFDGASCQEGKPLTSGYIAIKNIGDGPATLGAGAADTQRAAARVLGFIADTTWLAVYNPYNLDMKTENAAGGLTGKDRFLFQTPGLDPLDQKGFAFEFARNEKKDLRNYGPPDLSSGTRQVLSGRDEIRLIQNALNDDRNLKLSPKIVVDGAYGETTRKAVIKYQRMIGAEPTGILTRRQRDRLFQVSFNNVGAQTKVCVDIYAVVDPGNEIPESNESNNIAAWRVEIDCRPKVVKSRVRITPRNAYDYSACAPQY